MCWRLAWKSSNAWTHFNMSDGTGSLVFSLFLEAANHWSFWEFRDWFDNVLGGRGLHFEPDRHRTFLKIGHTPPSLLFVRFPKYGWVPFLNCMMSFLRDHWENEKIFSNEQSDVRSIVVLKTFSQSERTNLIALPVYDMLPIPITKMPVFAYVRIHCTGKKPRKFPMTMCVFICTFFVDTRRDHC